MPTPGTARHQEVHPSFGEQEGEAEDQAVEGAIRRERLRERRPPLSGNLNFPDFQFFKVAISAVGVLVGGYVRSTHGQCSESVSGEWPDQVFQV